MKHRKLPDPPELRMILEDESPSGISEASELGGGPLDPAKVREHLLSLAKMFTESKSTRHTDSNVHGDISKLLELTSPAGDVIDLRMVPTEQIRNIRELLIERKQVGHIDRIYPVVQVVNVTPRIIELLRRNPEDLRHLSPEQFERLVADRLVKMGFDVYQTGVVNTPDGGVDLIATPKQRGVGSYLLATQVKHHRTGRPTTRAEVDRLLAWKDSFFRLGLMVTNTRFTQPARWIAEQPSHRNFMRLRDFGDLKRWICDNFTDEADWSELPETIQLAPGVVIKIPKARKPE